MTTSTLACGKAKACVALRSQLHATTTSAHITRRRVSISTKARIHSRAQEETLAQRDLFVDILSTNATRRDAKQFLARLKDNKSAKQPQSRPRCPSVNLGSLYTPARAIADSPQFVREGESVQERRTHEKHIALIALRDASSLTEEVLNGVAATIAQLVKLDMQILFVLEGRQGLKNDAQARFDTVAQASRVARAIDEHCPQGARVVADAFIEDDEAHSLKMVSSRLIIEPLVQGVVVVIPGLAYTRVWQTRQASLKDVSRALVQLTRQSSADKPTMLLDRIILLEPLGGIPSKARNHDAHVYVNLDQEYTDIKNELTEMGLDTTEVSTHAANLDILNSALAELPHSSSALVVTPEEAAASSLKAVEATGGLGAGTRKQRNTLIHNLLTNKPLVSSSLPTARFKNAGARPTKILGATLVKKGMPLAIIPSISRTTSGWQVPENGVTSLDLRTDPRVDLQKLVHLINDSFRRKLDVDKYLERIRGRTAGLIVAGDYEGGAILTWEAPANCDATTEPARLVPYLDKFAVLQSSQGSAGVADVVFQAMVRTCFPQGVCWRSRSNNPVNKWYFERSAGSWTLKDTQWTMFWTGEGVVDDQCRWNDYVDVCKGIQPTWLDNKAPD